LLQRASGELSLPAELNEAGSVDRSLGLSGDLCCPGRRQVRQQGVCLGVKALKP